MQAWVGQYTCSESAMLHGRPLGILVSGPSGPSVRPCATSIRVLRIRASHWALHPLLGFAPRLAESVRDGLPLDETLAARGLEPR